MRRSISVNGTEAINRFFVILLFCLALLCSYGVWRAHVDLVTTHNYLADHGIDPASAEASHHAHVCWRSFSEIHWRRVIQCPPGTATWASGGLSTFRAGPRSWPESTETVIAFGLRNDPGGKHSQFSLPFSLSAILTTLSLLSLAAGGWLLAHSYRRRREHRVNGDKKTGL